MYAAGLAVLCSFKKLSSSYRFNAIPEWRRVSGVVAKIGF